MKFNFIFFIVYFAIFFVIGWAINLFSMNSLISTFVIAFFTSLFMSFILVRKQKPIKGLNLKLNNNETILDVYRVNLKRTNFNWATGNFFVTNQRFAFVDKRMDIYQTDYDIRIDEIKESNLLPHKFLKDEKIKIETFKNEVYFINAFQNNKNLLKHINR